MTKSAQNNLLRITLYPQHIFILQPKLFNLMHAKLQMQINEIRAQNMNLVRTRSRRSHNENEQWIFPPRYSKTKRKKCQEDSQED